MAQKIKLSILGISFSQVQAGAYALIFAEENGIRRLPIVIGTPEAQSIAIVMENITPPRPLTHDLVQTIFEKLKIELIEVYIYKFEDGAFFSDLLIRQNGEEFHFDSRTSDAVALAIRTNSPIYTNEEIMRNMSIVFDEQNPISIDEPAITASDNDEPESENLSELRLDSLKLRLEEAIRDEDYELATKLRDEINKRKSNT
ncbi:MAG: bifunctional nuclease family protein [Dysgonamonadaceae bacterium]|nr:bifunctional nuclease family protein [Dysgonamonadaceae bacterium]